MRERDQRLAPARDQRLSAMPFRGRRDAPAVCRDGSRQQRVSFRRRGRGELIDLGDGGRSVPAKPSRRHFGPDRGSPGARAASPLSPRGTEDLRASGVSSGTERRIPVEGVCGSPATALATGTQPGDPVAEVSDALRDALRDGQDQALNAAVDVVAKLRRRQAPFGSVSTTCTRRTRAHFRPALARQICAAPFAVAVAYAPLPPVARVFPAVAAELVAASGPAPRDPPALSPEQTRDALASVLGEGAEVRARRRGLRSTRTETSGFVSWAARRCCNAALRGRRRGRQEREASPPSPWKIPNEALVKKDRGRLRQHVRGDVCCELASARPTDALMLLDELAANGIVREDELGYAFAIIRCCARSCLSTCRCRVEPAASRGSWGCSRIRGEQSASHGLEVALHFMHAERAGFGTVAAHWAIRASELARANGDDAVAADYARCALRALEPCGRCASNSTR